MKSKNAKLLKEFTEFCEEHPNYRFWQALTNWITIKGRWAYIFLASNNDPKGHQNIEDVRGLDNFVDPYNWEEDIPDAGKYNR